ncbi:hypothetical protein P9E76_21825, partial [Schinkia azotoformans]|uniref:hypothetical protein n=2 Tax=Schinkia azotoformans TaxID=1454 RepID=UPI002DBE9778
TVSEFSKYFGLSTGSKGFQLLEKLDELRTVYGVIPEFGVFPFLEIHYQLGKLVLISHYLHHAFNMMLSDCFDRFGERGFYESDKVHASIVAERNKTAALIVIELVRLVVTAGRKGKPHISLRELAACIPTLYSIWVSKNSTSYKNRQLHRAFDGVVELLEQKTVLFNELQELTVNIPRLKVSSPNEVIRISFNNNRGRGEKSNEK